MAEIIFFNQFPNFPPHTHFNVYRNELSSLSPTQKSSTLYPFHKAPLLTYTLYIDHEHIPNIVQSSASVTTLTNSRNIIVYSLHRF